MLNDLLAGHEASRLVLITDTADSPGRLLLMNWIEKLSKRLDSIILVCTECQAEFFKSWLSNDILTRITFIDGRHDKKEDLLNVVSSTLMHVRGQSAVLCDSLSLYILLQHAPSVCRALHTIASDKRVSQVVAVLHQDVHDPHVCNLLEHTASSVLALKHQFLEQQICHIRHFRPSGKVFRTVECYSADENFHIQNIKPFQQTPKSSLQHFQDSSEDDPMSNLSFNLSLTETEKVVRSQVVLPYTNTGSGDNVGSSGRIHYEPDDADDLDEEDPDDDLNI